MKKRLLAVMLSSITLLTAVVPAVSAEELTGESVYTETQAPESMAPDLLTDGAEALPSEQETASETAETASVGDSELSVEPSEWGIRFVRDAMGDELDGEVTDQLFVEKDSTGKVTGVRVETYSTAGTATTLQQTVFWNAANGAWTLQKTDGTVTPVAAGFINLVSDWNWRIQTTDGQSTGVGGYEIKIENGRGTWQYFVTNEDIKDNGYQQLIPEVLTEVPAAFYVGLASSAASRAGLQTINGARYYLKEDGTIAVNEDLKIDGTDYYFGEDGRCVDSDSATSSGWEVIDNKTYYYDQNGKRVTGWLTLDNNTYFFDSNGVMKTGFVGYKGKRYYFEPETGRMHKGWLQIDSGDKFYCSSKGYMFFGLHNIGKKQYLFRSSGRLVTNEKILKSKNNYYVIDASGVVTKISETRGLARLRLKYCNWDVKKAFQWAASLKNTKVSGARLDGLQEYEYYAVYGFKNKKGDRFVMASCLYQMMKELGYNVHYVRGKVRAKGGKTVDTAWCDADFGSNVYVYDPYYTNQTRKSGFKFPYKKAGTWVYQNYYRVV